MSDKEKWRTLAAGLGFEFKEGIRTFMESPSLLAMAGGEMRIRDVEQAGKLLSHPMVQTILAKVFMGAATGRHRNFEFALLRSSSSSGSGSGSKTTYYVNVVLFFREGLRCGLNIEKAGGFTRLGRFFMPGRYVKVPNNDKMGKLLAMTARDKTQARVLLSDCNVQEALIALFGSADGFTVSDHGIRYKEAGRIIDLDRAKRLMETMADAADRIT